MVLRVISTKLSEEEHNKVTELCKESNCNISTFLKNCVMELMEKEGCKIEKPLEKVDFAENFSDVGKEKPPQEKKIAPNIRYQYF